MTSGTDGLIVKRAPGGCPGLQAMIGGGILEQPIQIREGGIATLVAVRFPKKGPKPGMRNKLVILNYCPACGMAMDEGVPACQ